MDEDFPAPEDPEGPDGQEFEDLEPEGLWEDKEREPEEVLFE